VQIGHGPATVIGQRRESTGRANAAGKAQ